MYAFSAAAYSLFTRLYFQQGSIGMWVCRFRRPRWCAPVRMEQQRKLTFFYTEVLIGLLEASSASMKAEIRSYQKCVSVFGVYTCVFTVSIFQVSTKVSVFSSVFSCMRVNERPKRRQMSPFLPEYVYV